MLTVNGIAAVVWSLAGLVIRLILDGVFVKSDYKL